MFQMTLVACYRPLDAGIAGVSARCAFDERKFKNQERLPHTGAIDPYYHRTYGLIPQEHHNESNSYCTPAGSENNRGRPVW